MITAGTLVAGVAFNDDGTKMFTSSAINWYDTEFINEYSFIYTI